MYARTMMEHSATRYVVGRKGGYSKVMIASGLRVQLLQFGTGSFPKSEARCEQPCILTTSTSDDIEKEDKSNVYQRCRQVD